MTGKWLRNAWHVVKEHPWVWIATSLGVGLGATMRLPLLPEMQDGAATIVGSAIGAVVAVGGAAYMANLQTTRDRRRGARLLALILQEISRGIELVLEAAAETDAADGDRAVMKLAGAMLSVRELHSTVDRVLRQLAIFATAGQDPYIALIAVDAQARLERHRPTFAKLVSETAGGPLETNPFQTHRIGNCEQHYRASLKPILLDLQELGPYFR